MAQGMLCVFWTLATSVQFHYNMVQFIGMKPEQNGRHSADSIFKRVFLNENVWITIIISL